MANKNKKMAVPNNNPQEPSVVVDDTIQAESARIETRRTRHSFYLDIAIVQSLDQAYKKTNHELYPREISKSDFLEECIRYALSYLDMIRINLVQEE